MVTIEEFAAIDIRVGRIVDAQELNSRKPMYGLKVDFGKEIGVKNIAAGIKDHYTREELLGKNVVAVVNLESKSIAGYISEGMLLAAEDVKNVALLQVDKEVEIGSRVR
jgi:export-related chaperone CsaA